MQVPHAVDRADGHHHLCHVEASHVFLEAIVLSQERKQIAARVVVCHQVQMGLVVERVLRASERNSSVLIRLTQKATL